MGARRDRSRPGRRDAVRAERLAMLAAVDAGEGDNEVLRHALLHAVAELGGLGGIAHLRRAPSFTGGLLLAASDGLSPFTGPWVSISDQGPAPPVRALRENRFVYVPRITAPEQQYRRPLPTSEAGPPAAGMASVPLPGPDGPSGALSVMLPEHQAPDPGQRAFLEEVARWVGGRLRRTSPGPGGVTPTLLHGQAKPDPELPRAERAGSWEWELRTDELTVGDRFFDALGIDSQEFDGTVEFWVRLVHPEDLSWAAAEIDRGLQARGRFDIEYRVRRADGTYGWMRIRGRVVTDEHGEPLRVVGDAWNTTGTHASLESVGRALLHMSDGFLSMTGDGRISFVNAAAERLLGPARELVGLPLWEVPALRDVPDVAERCRRAVGEGEGEPVSFEVPGPGRDQWYHLRLVPVPDGLTVYVTDVTERRAAERATAERAALMAGLTRALAEAVTAKDVVDAVADSVLPPFGASGLIVAALDHERLDIVGSVGYSRAFLDQVHGTPLSQAVTGEALRTRTPEFHESAEEFLARHPGRTDLAGAEGKQASAFLPLIVSGRSTGVCVISYDTPHHFGEDERTVLTALSGLVAQALDRASLYDAATTRARELQRALLPRVLPSLPALTAAARYLPSARGADIGGDWYDVIPLSADRVALVIGDVMGHGMPEAAMMGRLRTAVRTLSDLELPPDDLLARINDLVTDLGEESFTTCLYGIYDPATQVLTYANAGHLPPAVALPGAAGTFPGAAAFPAT
ncbi:SpoIIE family protein phosphatase, partial [Streptomyces sp. URMC 129]|uniref:SpoIIE family protein phosphatase n=1 Tax=Streptomyces sp. URMC 129 TaxID=3423407 RepID=UPI003F1B605C